MKKVLLVALSFLLVFCFVFAVYFHTENETLREQGKVRVFSVTKWIQSFSEVQFPEFSLSDIWNGERLYFRYTAGSSVPYKYMLKFLSGDTLDLFIGTYQSFAFVSDMNGEVFTFTFNGVTFRPDLSSRSVDWEGSGLFTYSWIPDVAITIEVDYSSSSELTLFFSRVGLTFDYIGDYGSAILTTVSKIIPYDAFEVIDIPNKDTVFDLGGSFYEN